MQTRVPWKLDAPSLEGRRILCARCGRYLAAGDEVYLDEEGPASEYDAALKSAGRAYTATEQPAHWRCHPTQGRTIGGS
jgi:hypothetical protein